jgi:Kef-type K+ transport system membrane component KefB
MKKYVLVYVLTLLGFGCGIYLLIQAGTRLEKSRPVPTAQAAQLAPTAAAGSGHALETLLDNLREPLSLLLVELIFIVLLARVFGRLFVRLGQPAVIGEMLAGIALGPSLLGALAPGVFNFVFPPASMGALKILSQVGVILFMFVVGMELDVEHLRNKVKAAVLVSHVSIIFPYFLGVLASYFIYSAFSEGTTSFLAFALFMGVSMSITAFPVLARILEERGLTGTQLGSTAITCAAVDDLSAWSLLAFVVAIVKADRAAEATLTVGLALLFAALIVFGVRPALNRWLAVRPQLGANPSRGAVVGILVFVFSSALVTEVIGIHALFGAFLAGIAMPAHPGFRLHLQERLESFSSAFLLPLFFAFTGLRTQIGLLDDWRGWAVCLGLIAFATLGKLGGSTLAARYTGMDWNDSFRLGTLMNTRGLVELIVLNIGLDLRILSPRVFAMMVLMALVTTCMTGPLLSLADAMRRKNPIEVGATLPR